MFPTRNDDYDDDYDGKSIMLIMLVVIIIIIMVMMEQLVVPILNYGAEWHRQYIYIYYEQVQYIGCGIGYIYCWKDILIVE